MRSFDLGRAVGGQKALGHHASFTDHSTPITTYGAGQPRRKSVLSKRSTGRHLDAYGGAQAIDHVYDAVNLYADAASTADYVLRDRKGTPLVRVKSPGTPPDHQVGPESLYKLLDAPNPFMAYDELMGLLTMDLLLVGDGYWYKYQKDSAGRPQTLYRLAPSHVKILPSQHGPEGYEYQPPGATKPLRLDPQDVIHFRRPNPNDPYYGLGVIQGAGRAMDLELAVTDTATHYYENRADPSLIIES